MLMALVLALGAQGNLADAITVNPATSSTTTSPSVTGSGFTSFTVAPSENAVRESVRITTNGGIQLIATGGGNSVRTTSLTLTEKDTNGANAVDGNFFSGNTDLGSTVTITGYFTSLNKRTITVTDTTPNSTNPAYTKVDPVTYTYYVVKSDNDIRPTDTIRLTKGGSGVNSQGYITGVDGRSDFYIHGGNSDLPVRYSAVGGGNLYYIDASGTKQSLSNTATLSSVISGRIQVWLDANNSGLTAAEDFDEGNTHIVTVDIGNTANADGKDAFKVAYIYGTPSLDINLTPDGGSAVDGDSTLTGAGTTVTANANDTKSKYSFTGGTAGSSAGTITATVTDGKGATVNSGVVVKFDLASTGTPGGYLSLTTGTIVDNTNRVPTSSPSIAQILYVQTDGSGIAAVTYRFGSVEKQDITVTAVGLPSKKVTAALSGASPLVLSMETNARQSGSTKKYDLVALVEDDGEIPTGRYAVTFRTNDGTLTRVTPNPAVADMATGQTAPGDFTTSDEEVDVGTNALGEAHVIYDIGDNTGRQEIHASIVIGSDRQEVTFVVNGPAQRTTTTTTTTEDTTPPTNTITVTPTSLSGEAGDVVSFRVSGIGATAFTVTGNAAFTSAGGLFTETGLTRTVRLPDTAGTTYSLTVSAISATGYDPVTVPVTVTAAAAPAAPSSGTLTITAVGSRSGSQQAIRVAASPTPTSALVVTLTGVTNPTTVTIPANSSSRTVAATLVNASAAQTLTATATNYDTGTVTIPAAAPGTGTGTGTGTRTVVTGGTPSRITISGLSAHSGTVNQQLELPLSVRVLDANGIGVADARVTFRVRRGQGRLSQRGNGLAIPKRTDQGGYARADFTPLGVGPITVEAKATGVTREVTFTITATGSAPTPETPGTGDPMPSTTVSPVLNAGVSAASRPPMLWVSGGKIYGLVGSEVKVFIGGVENAISLAVGGGKIYWTAQTSETHGTLNSANLDGTDAKELRALWGVPRGITVDTADSKLYWVDAANRLQRADLDGSDIQNVLRNLSDPKDVAVSGGNAYWVGNGDGTDTLVFVNLTDPKKEIHPIAATSGIYGGLAIAGSKVYWTEQVSETHGTLNSANLDGTGVAELRDESLWGAPRGIAVDTARSRLYWTDAVGRLQRSNLDGSGIHNVAKGLGLPGDMVISNSIMEPAQTPSKAPTASASKYDVNEDGTVTKADRNAVAAASLMDSPDAKYDVNGDGEVDVLDVLEVADNITLGAASAPTFLGMKLTAVQIERLQEQIEMLIATGDRSPTALKTLIYLQQLLATARPEKTQLLANYPNPFNPETWIPYELATDTDVRITIYNAQGVVIRTLQLGQQAAGYYTDRERAAYWDGRNALGEQVASGIYFYQLETDTLSTLRKMVILK